MATAATFKSDAFTFEVGVTKERFIVHKKAIEQHSPVLTTLINNGKMQESTTGIAWLEDVDPHTFGLFAEYIYTGVYRIVQVSASDLAGSPTTETSASKASLEQNPPCGTIRCRACNWIWTYWVGPEPLNQPLACENCLAVDAYVVGEDEAIARSTPRKNRYRSALQKQRNQNNHNDTRPDDNGLTKDRFKNLKYSALGKTHEGLETHLRNLYPQDMPTDQVSSHAMLYVFAQKYMIEPLTKLCLHKLHRDLMAFQISAESVTEIVAALTYAYENTSSSSSNDKGKSSEEGIGQELRNLMMVYAVRNAKKLLEFEPFRLMLQAGGDVVSDFTVGMSERLSD